MSKDKLKRFFRLTWRMFYVFLKRWAILIVAAMFLTWYLQYRVAGNDSEVAWQFLDERAAVFWYSALIIFTMVALIYGVVRKTFGTVGIAFGIVTVITYINNTKVAFRGTPLLPEDFQLADQAGSLMDFIDVWALIRVILAVILAVGLGFLLDYLAKKYLAYVPAKVWRQQKKILKKKSKSHKVKSAQKKVRIFRAVAVVGPRLVVIPAALVGFLVAVNPIVNHGGASSEKMEWLEGTEFVSWSQALNYEQNGFLLGFLYNVKGFKIATPEGYNKEKIAELKKTYEKEAESEENKSKTTLSDADYNIVIILNESFYDPTLMQSVYPFEGPDPLPVFHNLMETTPSGYMYSPEYGGGTANVEFEVDTGLSNYWMQTTPFTSILPKLAKITSLANDAKAAGYQTTAIHSYTSEMYKRSYVLPIEGYDRFITEDKMKHTERDGSSGGYINDRSIYQETLDLLEESEKKQLVSVLTMQDHAPYERSGYSEDELLFWFEDPNSTIDLADPITSYIQGVYYSDQYLGEFLAKLKKSDEKTVVLFFGDHAPGVFGKANTSLDKSLSDLTHLTPYFIWANFEMKDGFSNEKYGADFLKKFGGEEEDVVAELAEKITLPTTSPNCLTNALYGVLSLRRGAEETLLEQVCKEEPILAPVYLTDKQPSGKAVKDYELLNYDLLNGEQYWFSL